MKRLLVLGAAISGSAAARLGRRRGYAVTVFDRRPGVGNELLGEGIAVVTGRWDPDLLNGIDLVVTSPGVPLRSPAITDSMEAGISVWSELEFAWRELSIPVVAVTGTNGKTTVTEATAAMLSASGYKTAAVGNIGTALSDVVDEPHDLLVIEVSSFQLDLTDRFAPQTAVLLNISPDHLDWHPSLASYTAAKSKIFSRQQSSDLVVFDADDPGASTAVARAPSRRHPVSGHRRPDGGSGPEAGSLHLSTTSVFLDDLPSRDPALLVDLAAAGVAAIDRGARPEAVVEVCRRYRPGAHRRQVVATHLGITYVNDSKATNPHAALSAIRSYSSVVLIAGGLDKGLDIAPLATEPNVRWVVAIGTAAPTLLAAAPECSTSVQSMEEAVAVAHARARAGDTVLLAPGCASYDMFVNYAARGEAFSQAVRDVISKGGAP